MPREEVPYPCDCNECSTSQKLKTINGIEPNDGGNISILGDEGVTVKSDKNNHIVTFGIDTSTIDNVNHATSADTATNADFATKADSATKADTATKADSADFAARANYSVQASMANYDTKGKTIMNTDGAQDVTGAKTFSGDQTFTGAIGASGAITATGAINASNSANVLKVANHDTALISNDVLSAKDINEVNGSANNLLHRSGNETKAGNLILNEGDLQISKTNTPIIYLNTAFNRTVKPASSTTIGNLVFGDYSQDSFVTLYGVQNTDGSISVILATRTNKGNWRTVELLKAEWED